MISPKLSWLLVPLFLAACEEPKQPPKTVDDTDQGKNNAPKPTAVADDKDKDDDKNPHEVSVSDKVRQMCDLPEARFEFDSAYLSPQAKNVLDLLAKCFIDGKGKGEGLYIVGHADPRGGPDYNRGLGQRRAGAVESYLTKKGLADDRVESSSRGDLDATGTDDAGWAKDRRVEILLAGE